MRIIMIRHGDPDYENDTLTPKGIAEADALARYLKTVPVTRYYCSPLGRARDTAEPTLKAVGRKAHVLDWLREFPGYIIEEKTGRRRIPWDLTPGFWTGIPELFDKDKWMQADVMKSGNAVEVYKDVCNCLDDFLASYGYVRNGCYYSAVKPNHDTVVFFCHFGIGCVMLSHLLNISPIVLWQGAICLPTGVTCITTEEREDGIAYFRCSGYGDISHLTVSGQRPSLAGMFRETRYDMD